MRQEDFRFRSSWGFGGAAGSVTKSTAIENIRICELLWVRPLRCNTSFHFTVEHFLTVHQTKYKYFYSWSKAYTTESLLSVLQLPFYLLANSSKNVLNVINSCYFVVPATTESPSFLQVVDYLSLATTFALFSLMVHA
jgi:hypothetical protein